MKKIIIILLFLILIVPAVIVSASENEDEIEWKKVTENNYIDADGIIGTLDRYGFNFLLKSYNKGQYEPVDGKEIWYTLAQYTIDCGNKTYKIGVMDSYGYEDNFVSGDYNKFSTFQPIVSGTAVGEVAAKLCRE